MQDLRPQPLVLGGVGDEELAGAEGGISGCQARAGWGVAPLAVTEPPLSHQACQNTARQGVITGTYLGHYPPRRCA